MAREPSSREEVTPEKQIRIGQGKLRAERI
jgi:hypothetical protein